MLGRGILLILLLVLFESLYWELWLSRRMTEIVSEDHGCRYADDLKLYRRGLPSMDVIDSSIVYAALNNENFRSNLAWHTSNAAATFTLKLFHWEAERRALSRKLVDRSPLCRGRH